MSTREQMPLGGLEVGYKYERDIMLGIDTPDVVVPGRRSLFICGFLYHFSLVIN